MIKKSAGALVKQARRGLGMTQRQLAQHVGVRASHIAYIENDRRRPSLRLVQRLADILGIARPTLLFLVHPETIDLLRNFDGLAPSTGRRKNAWERFASNRPLLKRHKVTRAEMRVLKQVSLLESVSCPRHFLFILNAIRQSGVESE